MSEDIEEKRKALRKEFNHDARKVLDDIGYKQDIETALIQCREELEKLKKDMLKNNN